MILLFGEKASHKMTSKHHTPNSQSKPVESSGILAMNTGMTAIQAKSIMTMGEYDEFISSNPTIINYAASAVSSEYYSDSDSDSGFLASYSDALSAMGDCGFSAGGGECCTASCGSFSSVC